MNNILYFKPVIKESDTRISIEIEPSETDNYFSISRLTDRFHICIMATSFDNAVYMKTLAIQNLNRDYQTVMQEKRVFYQI